MTWTGCEETTWWLTWALRQETTQARLSDALAAAEPSGRIIEHMIADLEPAIAARVRTELTELPEATVFGILGAWKQAFERGRAFELSSARPTRMMDMARRRSVRLVVDVHEDGVTAELSHIGTRHPTWPASAAEALGKAAVHASR